MPVTTFLHEAQLDQPTGDKPIDDLLSEVRQETGLNWQIVTHKVLKRRGPLGAMFDRYSSELQLYIEVGGMAPWQIITCAYDKPTIAAYLFGVLSGIDERAKRTGGDHD